MKIAYFTDNFPPRIGGVATYSFELPYFLKQLHPEIEVEVFVFGKENTVENLDGLGVVRLKKQSVFKMGWQIAGIVRKGKFDVIHTTTFFPVGFFVALSGKIFKVKSFLTVYGTEVVTRHGSLITKLIQSLTLAWIGKIFPFSQSTCRLMLKRHKLNPGKAEVIYPGISQLPVTQVYDVREKLKITPDDFVILFVGRLVERKGALDLIKAVEQIGDEKIKLILVGGGERNELEKYIADKKLSDRVYFAGSINREEILNYYQASQVFSMPSFFDASRDDVEGLGIVYLEAQINGLPVIGTSSGGIPEAISDNSSGFVVEPRNIGALAEKIKLLKDDQKLYQKMSVGAIDFVKQEFSWRKNIEHHLSFYLVKSDAVGAGQFNRVNQK